MECGDCIYFKQIREHDIGRYGLCEHKKADWKNDAGETGTWDINKCFLLLKKYPNKWGFEQSLNMKDASLVEVGADQETIWMDEKNRNTEIYERLREAYEHWHKLYMEVGDTVPILVENPPQPPSKEQHVTMTMTGCDDGNLAVRKPPAGSGIGTSLKDGEFFKEKPPEPQIDAKRLDRIWKYLQGWMTTPKHEELQAWAIQTFGYAYYITGQKYPVELKDAVCQKLNTFTDAELTDLEKILEAVE